MKKGNVVKTVIVALILVLLAGGYYVYLSSRDQKKEKDGGGQEKVKLTNEEKLLQTNLKTAYPLTPTSVVSYYSDLLLTYYNEKCSEEMREKLMVQSRYLFDEELLNSNKEKDQLMNLEADAEEYEKQKKQIINYTVCAPEEVEHGTLDGSDVALVTVSYRMRRENDFSNLTEEYFLRKDGNGYWKIVGWQLKPGRKNEKSN